MDSERVVSALESAIDLAEKTGSVLVKTTPDVAKEAVEMLKKSQWHPMDWDTAVYQLEHNHYYLITHSYYDTPIKAKWDNKDVGHWVTLGGGDNNVVVYPWTEYFQVSAWMELPECYK